MVKIAKKIEELTGNDEREKKLKEQFSFLQNIANSKCNEFRIELEKMFEGEMDKCEVVGKRAIDYYQGQYVDIKSDCDETINDIIGSFYKGKSNLKDGFKVFVTAALSNLINEKSIGEYKENLFFIYPENFAIVRIDIKCYKYTFEKNGFISDCENVFCYTLAKSIVDHSKLTIDELLYFVTDMMNPNGEEVDTQQVAGFVQELEKIWETLSKHTSLHRNGMLYQTPEKGILTRKILNKGK